MIKLSVMIFLKLINCLHWTINLKVRYKVSGEIFTTSPSKNVISPMKVSINNIICRIWNQWDKELNRQAIIAITVFQSYLQCKSCLAIFWCGHYVFYIYSHCINGHWPPHPHFPPPFQFLLIIILNIHAFTTIQKSQPNTKHQTLNTKMNSSFTYQVNNCWWVKCCELSHDVGFDLLFDFLFNILIPLWTTFSNFTKWNFP